MPILAHPKPFQKRFEKDSAAAASAGIWDDFVSFWKFFRALDPPGCGAGTGSRRARQPNCII
jgi:hypothetical protein